MPIGPHLPRIYASFDKRTLAESLKYLNDRTSNSVISILGPVRKARNGCRTFKNLPLDSAVRLLAEMADLRVVQIDNVFYVTHRKRQSG